MPIGESSPVAFVLAAGTNALGVVRGLREARVPTVVVATSPEEPALQSRFPVRRVLAVAARDEDPDQALLEALLRSTAERAVLFPTSDRHVSFLARHRETLASSFDYLVPEEAAAETLIDKFLETELIEGIDVPLPTTVREIPPQPDRLLARLRLPVIVKPRSFAHYAVLGRKNVLLRSEAEATRFLEAHAPSLHRLIAQEVIPGGDDQQWVCNAVFGEDGRLLQAFTFRRLRLSPPHYGVTSFAISERNAHVVELCERIGRRLRYTGPAMIEFKHDPRDGGYKYIETNPRLGLCNWFDTRCGVNNVLCVYRLAAGLPYTPAQGQREGVLYVSFFEDVPSRFRDGEPLTSIASDYLRSLRCPRVGAYFDWRDPWPAAVAAWREGVLKAWRRLRPFGEARRAD